MASVAGDFGEIYQRFIDVLGRIADTATGNSTIDETLKGQVRDQLNAVLQEAMSPAAVVAVRNAACQLDPTSRNLLAQELEFFCDRYAGQVYGAAKEIDDGETGKDSILDLLDDWLPDWLKKLLKILDQILSLIRPS
ncbi:hypothetical protein AB4Y36_08275 [Paraburkholderia sp. BR10936]|uniref:hypothetical protein n=1 Tax=Paraburkholderia sp. BR10936 TaxID=3236993 RepID=UPI0034D2DA58